VPVLSLIAALALFSDANAAPACPWAGNKPPIIIVEDWEVIVDGQIYDAKSKGQRRKLSTYLQACNAPAAVIPFERWVERKQGANGYLIGGAVLLTLETIIIGLKGGEVGMLDGMALGLGAGELVAAPIMRNQADEFRDDFVFALQNSTPPVD
jgi:hypothetical protein